MSLPHINLFPIERNQTKCAECSIRRLALFNGVSLEELEWTQHYRSNQFNIKARKDVYFEKELTDYLFTVYHGWFALYKTLNNGKRQILRIALPGDLIGFQGHIDGPMQHSAISLTDGVLCSFPRQKMRELFQRSRKVAHRLTEINSRDMAICQNHLLGIGQQSAAERIAYLCLELFYRYKMIFKNGDDSAIPFPLSQEDIGDTVGLTKIHVNRTLKALREQRLLEISHKTLRIHELEELHRISSFDPSVLTTHELY